MNDSGLNDENRSIRIEKDAISSAIISGDGNKVVIYQYQLEHQSKQEKVSTTAKIGSNPYKGLLAFQEVDGDRYFGREKQIEKLWNLFRTLHENTIQPEASLRLLPILGPSGSGKSSLARAGLIPELARRPIPGKSQARVAVLVPGTHPIEALATVLARVATNDPTPVAKTREFAKELKQISSNTNDIIIYDGLLRIANVLPEIAISPLFVLVDQFEEVYSLCHDSTERQIFIENLIHAAGDRSGRVSVIITLRSDFLGETQQHPTLNQAIAKLGVIVPAMSTEELRRAITLPAEQAGYPLDEAVVNLLINDTLGREGALPLLQFALTRIWEGLKNGVQAIKTLEQIGGVGGALADEAQRIYEELNESEKKIAQRVFLGLVQLGEGTSDTRRRAKIDSLISYIDKPESVKRVIDRFAQPGVRLITLSSLHETETAEITHEALFAHWQQMRQWLDSSRSDIREQRRLDEAAVYWHQNGRPNGSLWRSPDLDLLRNYKQRANDNMTPLQVEFFQASQQADNNRKLLQWLGIGGLATGLFFFAYLWRNSEMRGIEQAALAAKALSSADPLTSLETAISLVGQSRSPLFSFPNQSLPPSVQDSLFTAVQNNREKNVLNSHQGRVYSVAISTDEQRIVSGGNDGTVRLWDIQGKQLATFRGHQGRVYSVAISTDNQRIVSGGIDGTVRLWDIQGKQLAVLRGHQGSVYSVAISTDNQRIVSGGEDGTVRFWDAQGKQVATFREHRGPVYSVAISTDNQRIVSGGEDGTVRLWDTQGKQVSTFKGHQGRVYSVAISTDDQRIVSGGIDGTVRLWDTQGKQLAVLTGHQGNVISVAISTDKQTIVSGAGDGTVRLWDTQSKQLAVLRDHQGNVTSVAISTDKQTIVSGGDDGTVRLWDTQGKQLATFRGHQGNVNSVAISTDNHTIVSGGDDGTVRLWDTQGKQFATFRGHQGSVFSVAISTNNHTIVSGGVDGTVRLWNTQGKQLATFRGHQGSVFSVAISTDNQKIVNGGLDGIVRLWDTQGKQLATFKGHQGSVQSVAISTDNQRIVSGGSDGTVRLWDTQGKQLAELRGPQHYVILVAISTNKQRIVSGGLDGTVQLWDIRFEPWLKAGCQQLQDLQVFTEPNTPEERGAKATCESDLKGL